MISTCVGSDLLSCCASLNNACWGYLEMPEEFDILSDPRHLDLDYTQLWAGNRFFDTVFVEEVLLLSTASLNP